MEVLELHGKRYISAGKAARDNGYTSDYVGQLCRSGAIDATRVGRGWYVSADAIKSHRSDKKRATGKVARSSLVKSVSVTRRRNSVGIDSDSYERRYSRVAGGVVMSHDVAPLIPELRKIEPRSVVGSLQKVVATDIHTFEDEQYTQDFENKTSDTTSPVDVVDDNTYSEPTVSVPITITHDKVDDEVDEEYISEIVTPEDTSIRTSEHIAPKYTPQESQNVPQSFSTRKTIRYAQVMLVIVCVLSVAFLATVLLVEQGEVHAGSATRTYTTDTTLLNNIIAGLRAR